MRLGRAKSRRGSAAVEFALASLILVPSFVGTFQFGYSFYLYNLLESAVANGARFGAMRTYRSTSQADLTKNISAIKNMVVYGHPAPGLNPVPLALGLSTDNVTVTYTFSAESVPTSVRVNIVNFSINALFATFNFNNKPSVTYPFLGRYAPNESEP